MSLQLVDLGADVKGNYKSIIVSSKKRYEAVPWEDSVETKGLAIEKDTNPIAKYALSRTMEILNSDMSNEDKVERLVALVGTLMECIQEERLEANEQVAEVKISGQPHYIYVNND
ncbi:uncharacterized protein FMAN_15461 [Fusarium mangiferae]|uniref:DNA-directed DNA polymerase n=1 Tax=Fusarium mangiferae TaxID=192010 RepID=A0A1L7UL81_FUSMA|nr:uncharacterized protein FMAN_15461 [Fusarium mangiferae]CVL09223.1 uncharacterized protein FMAN_15461 [Fusarium mangiferae]